MLNNSEVRVALTDVRTGEREVQAKIRRRLKKENEVLQKKLSVAKYDQTIWRNLHKLVYEKYKQALAPFEDEYFKGLDIKQIAGLAKKSIRLTTENRKLEAVLDEIEGKIEEINGSEILTFPDLSLQENARAIMRQCNEGYRQILDIIADLRTDGTRVSPDSEQMTPATAKPSRRNSVSVEQIQDSKAKGVKS